MALLKPGPFQWSARTTRHTENAIRALDCVLTDEAYLPRTAWHWREFFASRKYHGKRVDCYTRGRPAVIKKEKKFVRINGELESKERVSALVMFDGLVHDTEEDEYGFPLAPQFVILSVTAGGYTILKKKYHASNDGDGCDHDWFPVRDLLARCAA